MGFAVVPAAEGAGLQADGGRAKDRVLPGPPLGLVVPQGGEDLAREVVRLCEEEQGNFTFSYELDASIEEKLEAVTKKIYGGAGVVLTPAAKKQAERLTALGFDKVPVCVAKTQYSFSDDPALLGARHELPGLCKIPGAPELYLNEDHKASVPSDEVDLAQPGAIVHPQQLISLFSEILRCGGLSESAEKLCVRQCIFLR